MTHAQYEMVKARKVVLATNAYPPLLKRLKHYILPVYDYALITEPLSKSQRESIGWGRRLGLGVGVAHFGAHVMLDLLDGENNERTRLRMVRERPIPFPPEPIRSAIVNLTRWSMNQADRNEWKKNLWLRVLDATGLGFHS